MPEQIWEPDIIYVDRAAAMHPRTRRILSRLPRVTVKEVDDVDRFKRAGTVGTTEGKRGLFLTRKKGPFLSMCPGLTESAVCCNYRTINLAMGCNFDCSYCFLQAYLTHPFTTFFVNMDDLFDELSKTLTAHPGQMFRFGTGEFTDSLSLDAILDMNKDLIGFFSARPNAILELKTKSARVEPLLTLDHGKHTILAWSVNTDYIQAKEEHKTATVTERIMAANRCADAGYRVAFHFDPLIIHPSWEKGYAATVALLRTHIPESSIAWISYGALRYVPELKTRAQERFSGTPIFSNEFIKGFDGKMRYFTPLRNNLYRTVHRFIQDAFPGITPYLCMEPEHIWDRTLSGQTPDTEGLQRRLDAQAVGTNR